jgi:hypothetical protein
LEASPSGGITASSPLGPFVIKGTANYNGTGGGNFNGEVLQLSATGLAGISGTGIDAGGGKEIIVSHASVSCSLTYTVNSDGTFTQTLNCNQTFNVGGPPPAPGQTATLNGIPLGGQLALDGTVLVLNNTTASTATVETFTVTSGTNINFTNKRICNAHGQATSRR